MTDTPKDAPKRGSDPPSLPHDLGAYRLVKHIGAGGMGDVYLAYDTTLDRPVAVKFLTSIQAGDDEREQILLEARAAARLQHPNVVTIFQIGERGGRPFIISEYIEGQGLDKLIKPVPYAEALELGIGLARGLAAAHRRNVLHRDIKPGNAIIAANGAVKLLDFGLAKIVDELAPQSWGQMTDSPPPPPPPEEPTAPAPPQAPRSDDDANERALRTTQPDPIREEASPDSTVTAPGLLPGAKLSINPVIHHVNGPASSVVRGTPYYMAPEIWKGHKATRRSDVYSLGSVLYELCTGAPPHKETPVHSLAQWVTTHDAAPLAKAAPLVDPRFAAIVDRCLRRDPAERFHSGDELREALEQLSPPMARDSVPEGNPYRFLLPFEAEHRALFFGRSSEIGTLLERLRTERFVLVTGDSGVGKSSLCRAGVLPLVIDGGLGGARRWSKVQLLPGRSPLASLCAALAGLFGTTEAALADRLRAEPSAAARDLATRLGDAEGVIVFIDQLEELVTVGDPVETALVGEVLGYLASDLPGVRLLATARSDFLARIASIQGLGDELPRVLYFLRPMSPEKIREAIVGPARVKGVSFESDDLVGKLVESTARAEGGLPLLQFALAELWQARPQNTQVITAEALSAIGGVSGALARHADNVIHALPHAQRAAARRMLIALVTPEGTRARRTEGELAGDDASALATLRALVQGRLLVARETEGGVAYEMAHEALLKGWDTLRRWIDEQAGSRAVKQRLEVATAEWERLGRTREALWSERQLAEALGLGPEVVTEREAAFLEASRRAVRRKRFVWGALLAGLPVILATSYVGVKYTQSRAQEITRETELKSRREQIDAQLRRASATLELGRGAADQAKALRGQAAKELEKHQRKAGEELLTKALAKAAEADAHFADAIDELEAAQASEPSRKDVSAALRTALHERARAADADFNTALRDQLLAKIVTLDGPGSPRATSRIVIETSPPGAEVLIERVSEGEHQRRVIAGATSRGATPLSGSLDPGSYLLTLSMAGRLLTRYPVRVGIGEAVAVRVALPAAEKVPNDFVYIPAGRFLFGSAGDAKLRNFLKTTPLHEASTGSYLIARRETTFGDWIAFLEALPAAERGPRLPSASERFYQGALKLSQPSEGVWELTFKPGETPYKVRTGQLHTYAGRAERATQDWTKLPVAGVSSEDIKAYARWFAAARGVPGARLCSEHEWERAARGADEREYPHGDLLLPSDANFEETYGETGMGPDEVGSHPASTSPFGVDDMVGNIFEWTTSPLTSSGFALRGGSYSFESASSLSVNRNPLNDPLVRDATVGFRLCAPAPEP